MFGALSAAAFFKLSYTFPFQQLSGLVSSPRSARSLTPTDALPCTARVSTPRATSTPRRSPAPRLTRVDPLDAFGSSSNASFSQRRTSVSRTPRPDQSPAPASPRSPPRVARHRPSTQVRESGLAVIPESQSSSGLQVTSNYHIQVPFLLLRTPKPHPGAQGGVFRAPQLFGGLVGDGDGGGPPSGRRRVAERCG